MNDTTEAALVVSRTIRAKPQRVFDAWTQPEQLLKWWGPSDVQCNLAEVDLRVGGRYRLGNAMPNGDVLVITGTFTEVDPPRRLAYTWGFEPATEQTERVRVEIEPHDEGTKITIVHERIANEAMREGHERGWIGCLDGLSELLQNPNT